MNLANAQAALDRLEAVYSARSKWIGAAVEIKERFTSMRGVSGDLLFVEKATELFDGQVQHIIRQERARLLAELDKWFPEVDR